MCIEVDRNSFFSDRGYFLEKSVLDKQSVKELRTFILNLYKKKYGPDVTAKQRFLSVNDVIPCQEIMGAYFSSKIVQCLKKLLEEHFIIIPDFAIQISCYDFIRNGGWHFDSRSEMPNAYLLHANYRFVHCVLCLQDNSAEYAGGIDVVPGSHRVPKVGHRKINFALHRMKARLMKNKCELRLPIRAGDFLCFDSRLYHRSSPPSLSFLQTVNKEELNAGYISINRFDADSIKINLFFNACRVPFGEFFIENSVKRANKEMERNQQTELFFSQYCGLAFPQDFPSYFVDMINKCELDVAYVKNEKLRQQYKNFVYKDNF